MRCLVSLSLIALFAAGLMQPAPAHPSTVRLPAGGEWAKGIPYTTDWDTAIKKARESGRILMIYNGWQREGI